MLLRNSISTTKKFFRRTIDGFKSLLSKGGGEYEKLPKTCTPPFHPFSCGRDATNVEIDTGLKDLDNFYTEFTNQWDSRKSKTKHKGEKKPAHSATKHSQELCADVSKKVNGNCIATSVKEHTVAAVPIKHGTEFSTEIGYDGLETVHNLKANHSERSEILTSKRSYVGQGNWKPDLCSRSVREKRLSLVADKLMELQLLVKGNVEHKLDIEEFLHYYARLSCPAYLDIVDKFFTEMSAEFFGSQAYRLT